MKILLDECVPWPMRKMLANHECSNPFKCGWNGVTNGELLKFAENEFELFITADQNLRYQQNLAGRRIAILELSTNDFRRILAAESAIVELSRPLREANTCNWKFRSHERHLTGNRGHGPRLPERVAILLAVGGSALPL